MVGTRATTRYELESLSRDELIEKALEATNFMEELRDIKNTHESFWDRIV